MRTLARAVVAALSLAAPLSAPVLAEPPPLVPRDVLFGNPERSSPKISPDGKRLGWIAPDDKDVLQVWVQTIGQEDKKKVTADRKRGIRRWFWAEDDRTLLYLQDSDGDETWHLYGVDLETGNVRDYTPFQGVRAGEVETSPTVRDRLVVTLNLRDRRLMDVHLLDLATGALALDTRNPGDVAGWTVTDDLAVRGAQVVTPDGGTEIRVRADAASPWKTLLKVGPDESLDLLDFSAGGKSVLLQSSIGSDTAGVVERDVATGAEKVLASDPRVDAGRTLIQPLRHVVQAVDFPAGRSAWVVLDPTVRGDFEGIRKLSGGDFQVVNRDRDDRTWLVAFTEDRGPIRYYAWDRAGRKGAFLFVHQPRLEGLPLAEMKAVVAKARDGLAINSYLTLPPGLAPGKLPLVLWVHGGPWSRDHWGFNPYAQWLANRGYAVLQPNFRGSTGYGKKFLHAGDRQWGKAMHQDLVDAASWAVKQGVADPKRIAIAGGSYGGYSALAGAAFTPDFFRCAVDVVGPSSIFTLIKSIPPYWAPIRAMFDKRIGNVDDPRDRELLEAASPLFSAGRIRIPLLIGQGANDPRVKQAESEQIVAAIEKNGGAATYVVYSDEGHGFARPENRIDFNARMEAFLADCLGGRAEPMAGERMPGSTAQVKVVAGRK